MKKHSYSGRRKSHPSGAALPPAPPPIPPSASASSEAGRRSPSLDSSSLPSEGRGHAEKSEGVSRVGSRGVSSPHLAPQQERGGGGGMVLFSGGKGVSTVSSLRGGGGGW